MRAGLAGNSRYQWVVVAIGRLAWLCGTFVLWHGPAKLAEHHSGAPALEPGREHLLTVGATIIGLASDWRRLVPGVIDQYGPSTS